VVWWESSRDERGETVSRILTPDEARDYEVEYYPTPEPFTAWLCVELADAFGVHTLGHLCEPMVGTGEIVSVVRTLSAVVRVDRCTTGDIDTRRRADVHGDATRVETWERLSLPGQIDWTITNPAFNVALPVIARALESSRVGVAMHVRCTLNEPLKTPGLGRSFLREHPPSAMLWLPRFAYARSRTTGKWATDSAPCVWMVWLHGWTGGQVIRYAPGWVIDAAIRSQRARRGVS
jgi:hypothetical protein